MKNILRIMTCFSVFAAVFTAFLITAEPAYAVRKSVKYPDYNRLKKVSRNTKILDALVVLKESPAKNAYRRLLGDNSTHRPVKVKFKNLAKINEKYTNCDAVNKTKKHKSRIYISDKYKKAPPEIIAVSMAGMSVHEDKKNSINEETYSWALETVLWSYFTAKNPEIKNYSSSFTDREEALLKLYLKSPRDSKYIVNTVRKNNPHIRYKWESRGFSHREYKEKMGKLSEAYKEIQNMNNAIVPVANETVKNTDDKAEECINTETVGEENADYVECTCTVAPETCRMPENCKCDKPSEEQKEALVEEEAKN